MANDATITAWIDHLGVGQEKFPRDVASPKRILALNQSEYINLIENKVQSRNLYAGLYSQPYVETGIYDKIFLDLDSPDLRESHKEVQLIAQKLESMKCKPRVYFSGNGFAVYVDVYPSAFNRAQLRMWAFNLQQELNLKTLDWCVIGDRRRVSRLPYTFNLKAIKRGEQVRMCVPINSKWSIHRILAESIRPTVESIDIKPVRPEWIGLDSTQPLESVERIAARIAMGDKALLPIDTMNAASSVSKLVKMATRIKDGRHRILHYILVPSLLALKYTPDEVHSFCKGFITMSNKNYESYRDYVSLSITRTIDQNWQPWTFDKFLSTHIDLIEQFRR